MSIVYAAKVNGLYAAKQYDEAETASKNAKKWAIIAAVSGVVIDIIYIIFALLGTAAVSA